MHRSWVPEADGHPDFPLDNLPLCVFSPRPDQAPRGGMRVGDHLLDLAGLAASGLLLGPALDAAQAASGASLNRLAALGPAARVALRTDVQALLDLNAHGRTRAGVEPLLHPVADAALHLPFTVGDYTDFYAGRHHAEHVGALFRPDAPLLPNYDWVPIGYHGRASTVRVSGTEVVRPVGQLGPDGNGVPVVGPTRQLDFELELGVWAGASPVAGAPVPISRASAQIMGYCLLDDWSARDVQSWEYRPLGPFLAKSFATSVSAYVVTPEALAPYRAPLRRTGPDPLPYLTDPDDLAGGGLDVALEVALTTTAMRANGDAEVVLSGSHTAHLAWTPAQLVTHHTLGGCELRPGDLLGTGTISTPGPEGLGCLLEMTRGGADPVRLPSGESRTFLEDGDEVVLRARAVRPGSPPVGFGECRGRVVPAR